VGGSSGRAREHRGVVVELVDEKAAPDRNLRRLATGMCSGGGRTRWRSTLHGAPRLPVLDTTLVRRMEDGTTALGA
jgi:hypothetical protein